MTDSVTQVGLYTPINNADVDTWDQPVNGNSHAIDAMLATVSSVSGLTNANVTLSLPPTGPQYPWAANQSQSAVLTFTGTLTGNVIITLPRPGFWIVYNKCTVGAFLVKLASAAPGNVICAPPGEMCHVFCDGTDVNYVNLGRVGEYLFLGATTVPAWILGCNVRPYLYCDGTAFNGTTYPNLAALLGGTTLPDLRGRVWASLNDGTGRITTGSGGVDGNTLRASGGVDSNTLTNANLPTSIPYTDSTGHTHSTGQTGTNTSSVTGPSGTTIVIGSGPTVTGNTVISSIVINPVGANTPFTNMPPAEIGGIVLVRTG